VCVCVCVCANDGDVKWQLIVSSANGSAPAAVGAGLCGTRFAHPHPPTLGAMGLTPPPTVLYSPSRTRPAETTTTTTATLYIHTIYPRPIYSWETLTHELDSMDMLLAVACCCVDSWALLSLGEGYWFSRCWPPENFDSLWGGHLVIWRGNSTDSAGR
jgi:hypothetical protein